MSFDINANMRFRVNFTKETSEVIRDRPAMQTVPSAFTVEVSLAQLHDTVAEIERKGYTVSRIQWLNDSNLMT